MKHKSLWILLVLLLVGAIALPSTAQELPSVDVGPQPVLDGTVTINSAYAVIPGFIVIHADNGEGAPGPVIGYRSINAGWSYNVSVPVDASMATPTLFAMLHIDSGEMGVYEFGTVEGADGPVILDGAPVTPPFSVDVIHAHDQFVQDNTVTIARVVAQSDGWLVMHSDNGDRPGPVLGQAQVSAGVNENVVVTLEGDATPVLWPMLHVDTGEAGVYEFGTVEGADGPVAPGGQVAVTPFWTVPHIRANAQIVSYSDGMDMMEVPTFTAESVLSEGDGWLVIHASNEEGRVGPVVGYAPVGPGLTTDVTVELDAEGVTPILWPMLHVDTGEVGAYEFGSVEGADGPVVLEDGPVVFALNAAPSIVYEGSLDGSTLTVASALIDAHGWLVIHADNGEGGPGPVLGYTPLAKGLNNNVVVELDSEMMTETVFPMLHVDTGEPGVYEFGTVEGADGPVFVGGAPVVGPLFPEMSE